MAKGLIVLFHGQSRYQLLGFFSQALAQAWQAMGYQVLSVDLREAQAPQKIQDLLKEDPSAFFSFNGMRASIDLPEQSYYDQFQCPLLTFLVDHPIHHMDVIGEKIENLQFFCVDQDHLNSPAWHQPRQKAFCAHGAVAAEGSKNFSERTVPLMFAGYLDDPERVRSFWQRRNSQEQSLLNDCSEALLNDHNLTLDRAWQQWSEASSKIHQDNHQRFFPIMQEVDAYVRCHHRVRCLTQVIEAGLPLQAWGEGAGWETLQAKYASQPFAFHGLVSLGQMNALLNESQVVLNILPGFKNGSHERALMAMAQGAFCLSERNHWLDEHFKDQHDLGLWSGDQWESLGDVCHQLSGKANDLAAIAQQGQAEVHRAHLWEHRAQQILELAADRLVKVSS